MRFGAEIVGKHLCNLEIKNVNFGWLNWIWKVQYELSAI